MKVAIAIIKDQNNRVLITQRPLHVPHGGYWEFPGGKVEPDESPQNALVREIREELGIEVNQTQFLGDIHHHYPDQSVQLIVFLVTQFQGIPSCLEGQLDMKWTTISELNKDHFPKANHKIFQFIS